MQVATTHNRFYKGIPLGFLIRRSLGKQRIFRVRPGNGAANARTDRLYQDQYDYFVPASITNPQAEPYRVRFAGAVYKWQTELTDSQKAAYNKKARIKNLMSGYNLFIREEMTKND